jgi:hypothetical protein
MYDILEVGLFAANAKLIYITGLGYYRVGNQGMNN